MNTPNNSFMIVMVLVFVAVLLFLEFLYVMWRSHRGPEVNRLNERLRALSATRDRTSETRVLRERIMSQLPTADRILSGMPRMHGLDRFIIQSGLQWTVGNLILGCALSALVGWFAADRAGLPSVWARLMLAAVAASLPLLVVTWKRSRRLRRLQLQLPEALELMARALKAGHAFPAALKMTGEEIAEPIAAEFRTVHDEVNFGVSLPQALTHLSDRVPLPDLRFFVVAVLIQRESGGNLTEILGNLSHLIRERLKLFARIRVLSSEGRLSAWVLAVMPFALAAVMNIFNPTFMSSLWKDPLGIAIIQYTLALMVAGILILVKIVKIRV
jgi:tight adherence protein B